MRPSSKSQLEYGKTDFVLYSNEFGIFRQILILSIMRLESSVKKEKSSEQIMKKRRHF